MDGGDEDDGGLLKARMPVHHVRELKAVDLGHADVHQDDGDIVSEQLLHRLAGRPGLDQVLAQLTEDRFVAEQLPSLIIDHEYVGSIAFVHGPFLPPKFLALLQFQMQLIDATTCVARTITVPCSLVWRGTPKRPPADTFRDRPSWPWRSAR